jgi:molecular chaperone DnaK
MAKDNKTIGRFHLDGIPPSMRGIPQIEVTFDIDANGIIQVSALDKGTNKKQEIRIESSSGLSKEDIEKMKKDAELNAESDKKFKEEAELINTADSTVFQMEKSLKDLDDKLSEEQKSEVVNGIEELKKSISGRDIESIRTKLDEINLKFQKISQDLYNQTTTDTGFDVEFEEVNKN